MFQRHTWVEVVDRFQIVRKNQIISRSDVSLFVDNKRVCSPWLELMIGGRYTDTWLFLSARLLHPFTAHKFTIVTFSAIADKHKIT